MLNPGLALFLTMAAKSLTGADFDAHVQGVLLDRPQDEARITQVALLAQDWVLHYEQAVVLGTTADYEEQTKIWHFEQMLKGADEMCSDINLFTCLSDLVCDNQIGHNLNRDMMGCP